MGTVILDETTRARLRALVTARGERQLLADFDVSRNALARGLAGLAVRRGTAALLQERLARVEAKK